MSRKISLKEFDVIVFSERIISSEIIMESGIPTVVVDSLDAPNIYLQDLQFVSLYFKCQLPKSRSDWYLSDVENRSIIYSDYLNVKSNKQVNLPDLETDKILPFPYSTFLTPRKSTIPRPTREVFFLGWDSGNDSNRRSVVATLREGADRNGFQFSGGLFPRKNLRDEDPPSELYHSSISPISLYNSTCKDFKINIVPRSNGQLSFRLFDLLSFGCFVLAEGLDVGILPYEPEDGNHLVYFDSDRSNLVDLIDFYLENGEERNRIAMAGYDFYWDHLTPKHIASYFLSCLKGKL